MERTNGSVIKLKLKEIKPYKRNAKLHPESQIEKIRDSIISFGYKDLIAVDENNVVLEGHGRLRALYQIDATGEKEIDVWQITDLNEPEKRAYRIAHNKLNMMTEFDVKVLKEEFYELEDTENFTDTGFETNEITEMWDEDKEVVEDKVDVDAYERAKNKTKIQLGEVYLLGNHRLMCGDSTEKDQVNKLMNGQKADMILTDPPYGVDYASKNEFLNSIAPGNRNQTPIKGDKDVDIFELVSNFLKCVELSDYNTTYVFSSGKHIAEMINSFKEAGYYYSQDLKWVKNNHVLGRLDYNPKSENIIYGWKGKHKFYGGFQTDILEFNKPNSSKEHPTMKPLDLIGELIKHGSQSQMSIYDGFGGSGSTLIACEQLNRKCFMMELDPVYCQVIIDRWEKFTNKKAIKE